MRVNAYLLAGDPVWATESLRSYYTLVERVFVSFDRTRRSWAGHPLAVDETLAALRAADPEGKLRLLPGDYCHPERLSLDVETEQRQAALSAAAESSEWVLQFDTDEILLSPATFLTHLAEAERRGAEAMDYPLRNFYVQFGRNSFLERCRRLWTPQSSYPGPLAVRSTVALHHCRQADVPTYRVDMRPWNTDPSRGFETRVHAVVRPQDAVAHMSWVRPPEQMRAKARVSGHAKTIDWDGPLRQWEWSSRHPWLTVAGSPFRGDFDHYRPTHLDL